MIWTFLLFLGLIGAVGTVIIADKWNVTNPSEWKICVAVGVLIGSALLTLVSFLVFLWKTIQ